MALVYNLNNSATQVLAAKQVKENIFLGLLHRNGKGVTEQTETNATTIRMMKAVPSTAAARKLGASTNGGWFNSEGAAIQDVVEYDLPLLYVFDRCYDIPVLQEDVVPVNLFDATTKNIGGIINKEINASTIAEQLANRFNAAKTATKWDGIAVVVGTGSKAAYDAFMEASVMLDNGDEENGIDSFPFDEREVLIRPEFRKTLMSQAGVVTGGSNFMQSMIAKGAVSPDATKDFGTCYVGEIDMVPCFSASAPVWNRAAAWLGGDATVAKVEALMCAASATDRGISDQDRIKTIESPDGQGKRLQPLVRWGVHVSYGKGIVPILKNGTAVPSANATVNAPGSV